MRLMLLLFTLALSSSSWALRELTPQAFSTRVTPSLNSIQSDYFQILNQFPEFPRELPPLINQFYAQQELNNQLPLECPRQLTPQCIKEIKALQSHVLELSQTLETVLTKLRPGTTNYLYPLIGIKHLTHSANSLWALKLEIDFSSFLIDAELPSTLRSLDVIRRLDQIRTELILGMLHFIPALYRQEFETFYYGFIHPLRLNKNHEFFVSNYSRLNFNLNLFVQSLTKRNKKTPDGSNQYLQLMHMRWNGILRFYK